MRGVLRVELVSVDRNVGFLLELMGSNVNMYGRPQPTSLENEKLFACVFAADDGVNNTFLIGITIG